MKKILKPLLILIAIILFLICIYQMTFKSLKIGVIRIAGFKEISQASKQLDTNIKETNKLIDEDHPKAMAGLNDEAKKLIKAKQDYLDYVNLTDNEQILAANNKEKFEIEFLWTRIGNYATKQGVNVKFEISQKNLQESEKAATCKLNFNIKGSYVSIIDFIYNLEEDMDLGFTIENFKLTKGEATFEVNNVVIDEASLLEANTSSSTSVETEANKEKTQNEESNENTENNEQDNSNASANETDKANTTNNSKNKENVNNTTTR
ncbi:MAG: hypothetical protein Q4G05_00520 [Clostridia bacterium]|nr:hypothetical protein [Clostridia bacterium]